MTYGHLQTVCTPGSAPGPTLGVEYGKPLPLPLLHRFRSINDIYWLPGYVWFTVHALNTSHDILKTVLSRQSTAVTTVNKSSAVAEMGDRLTTNRHGPKSAGCCAPFGRGLGPYLTHCHLNRGLHRYQVAS